MKLLSVLSTGILIGAAASLRPFLNFPYMQPCAEGAGVCMTGIECSLQRGRSLGSCSLGTCCRLEKTCNERIRANNTFFVNPDNVQPGSSCSVEVLKKWNIAGVCQMRLDFIEFDTVGPNFASGMCAYDTFTVSGASTPVPDICGLNDKQHMYVDMRNSRSIQLSMKLGHNATRRKWRIKVTQIPCRSERLAPPHCLQYFEEDSGIISSFNYGNLHNDSAYPLNMRYQMCFRKMCRMQLSQHGSFGLGRKSDAGKAADRIQEVEIDADCRKPKEDSLEKAHLMIDGIRFCGNKFLNQYTTGGAISSIDFIAPALENDRNNPNNAPFDGFSIEFKQSC